MALKRRESVVAIIETGRILNFLLDPYYGENMKLM